MSPQRSLTAQVVGFQDSQRRNVCIESWDPQPLSSQNDGNRLILKLHQHVISLNVMRFAVESGGQGDHQQSMVLACQTIDTRALLKTDSGRRLLRGRESIWE
jgi:hypothetical protein